MQSQHYKRPHSRWHWPLCVTYFTIAFTLSDLLFPVLLSYSAEKGKFSSRDVELIHKTLALIWSRWTVTPKNTLTDSYTHTHTHTPHTHTQWHRDTHSKPTAVPGPLVGITLMPAWWNSGIIQFLPARRCHRGICCYRMSVCLPVCHKSLESYT